MYISASFCSKVSFVGYVVKSYGLISQRGLPLNDSEPVELGDVTVDGRNPAPPV